VTRPSQTEQLALLEAGLDGREALQAFGQEAGDGHSDDGERGLSYQEEVAQAGGCAAFQAGAAAQLCGDVGAAGS
jgi:hypothetical protein